MPYFCVLCDDRIQPHHGAMATVICRPTEPDARRFEARYSAEEGVTRGTDPPAESSSLRAFFLLSLKARYHRGYSARHSRAQVRPTH